MSNSRNLYDIGENYKVKEYDEKIPEKTVRNQAGPVKRFLG